MCYPLGGGQAFRSRNLVFFSHTRVVARACAQGLRMRHTRPRFFSIYYQQQVPIVSQWVVFRILWCSNNFILSVDTRQVARSQVEVATPARMALRVCLRLRCACLAHARCMPAPGACLQFPGQYFFDITFECRRFSQKWYKQFFNCFEAYPYVGCTRPK